MNFLQRWLIRLAARLIPPLNTILRTGHGSIERAEERIRSLEDRNSARKQRIAEERLEIIETIQMLGPQWVPGGPVSKVAVESMREAGAPAGVVKCYERLWDLELALEDRGWVRELSAANFEFSLFGIHRIIGMCRLYRVKNPIIRRGIQITAIYIFGRGISITSDDPDENDVLQATINDPRNRAVLGHTGMVESEERTWTDGNIFTVCFRDPVDGATIFRQIDPVEIVKIVTDPDDACVQRYFHRRWMSLEFDPATAIDQPTPSEAWYPAVGYEPDEGSRPTTMGPRDIPIRWDQPILHYKASGFAKEQWGIPRAYPAIEYARAVAKLIQNWCSIQEAMARFAWQVETQGGLPAIANLKQAFASTLATGDGSMYEQNPPPNAASTWISGPGNKLTMSKTSNMIDSPEVGRRVSHMAYMVFGLPETFFADASVGTVATATTLDRPTELKFRDAQMGWREYYQVLLGIAADNSIRATKGKLREARVQRPKPKLSVINVQFPSVLEHDILAQVNAIVAAGTLNGYEVTGIDQRVLIGLLLQELEVENWKDVLELMYPEAEYEDLIDRTELMAKQREDELTAPVAPDPSMGPTGVPTPANKQNPTDPAAPPQPPAIKKAKPKRAMSSNEAAQLQRAVAGLTKAIESARKRNAA